MSDAPHRILALGLAALLAFAPLPGAAASLDTPARAAIVIDHDTGTVLLEKNADTPLPPASMSKLMTLYMLFEALKDGRVSMDETLPVSERAQSMQGSTMFLDTTDRVSVEDLILGIIVQSGNDACVVVAERLAGSEEEFSRRMTTRAREMGMMDSVFANSTGWPDPQHRMSTRDLATLATRMIRDFPDYYEYFARAEFDFDGRAPSNRFNRNPLLGLTIGADGLKTGHTEEAGYGLVGSAIQDGRRVTMVVTGLESNQSRLAESERLITWAFREFASRQVYAPGEAILNADVWLGQTATVQLVAPEGITAIIPWTERDKMQAWVEYDGPIEAPVAAGDLVAELVIALPGIGETRYPLAAGADVARGGFLKKLQASATILMGKAITAAMSSGS